MRVATSFFLIAGLVGGSALVVAPPAVAETGSVTVCAKAPGKSAPVSIEVGFLHDDVVEGNSYVVADNTCVTVTPAPAPSGVWTQASRQAKRIEVATPSGKTNIKKTRRADFSIGSGEAVTVTFYFTQR